MTRHVICSKMCIRDSTENGHVSLTTDFQDGNLVLTVEDTGTGMTAEEQQHDVWLLGKHRVICGDSILPETYNILMDGRKANLILTDPPYNVDVEETAGKIKNDNMADEDFYKFLFAAFVNMEQNMEGDASIYVFHADTEGLNFRKAFADAGFKLSGCCIWKKNALVLGRSPYLKMI